MALKISGVTTSGCFLRKSCTMNYLTEDFDSLTALPLGIWQTENECTFEELPIRNGLQYDSVCVDNHSDRASPNVSKTYTELHVFPKQEVDSPSFLPLAIPFTDITNAENYEQNVCAMVEEESYPKGEQEQIFLSIFLF